MKLYAPAYYRDFVCIADQCRHSCCIGWEIDVDDDTMQKYKALKTGYGKEIVQSIASNGEAPHFCLTEGERCPHLNDRGLCRIILSLGEEWLCDICREHPRFYLTTARGMEVGLGMACEEACRLILASDSNQPFVLIGEVDGDAEEIGFDALPHRARLYSILFDPTVSYVERLQAICNSYGVSLSGRSDVEWRELLSSLEYLNDAHRNLFAQYSTSVSVLPELEISLARALAYFIFRHCTEVEDEEELRYALGFSLFCERLLASVASTLGIEDTDGLIGLAQAVSEELEYSVENTEEIKAAFFR